MLLLLFRGPSLLLLLLLLLLFASESPDGGGGSAHPTGMRSKWQEGCGVLTRWMMGRGCRPRMSAASSNRKWTWGAWMECKRAKRESSQTSNYALFSWCVWNPKQDIRTVELVRFAQPQPPIEAYGEVFHALGICLSGFTAHDIDHDMTSRIRKHILPPRQVSCQQWTTTLGAEMSASP